MIAFLNHVSTAAKLFRLRKAGLLVLIGLIALAIGTATPAFADTVSSGGLSVTYTSYTANNPLVILEPNTGMIAFAVSNNTGNAVSLTYPDPIWFAGEDSASDCNETAGPTDCDDVESTSPANGKLLTLDANNTASFTLNVFTGGSDVSEAFEDYDWNEWNYALTFTDTGTNNFVNVSEYVTVSETPEPGSMLLLGSGLLSLAGVVWRKYHRG